MRANRLICIWGILLVFLLCQVSVIFGQSDEYEYEDEEEVANSVPSKQQQNVQSPSAAVADEYEYEYEEEEVLAAPFSNSQQQQRQQQNNFEQQHHQQQASFQNVDDSDIVTRNGFIRHGGGLMKIGRPLVDEVYINETVDKYDCVRFVDSLVHIVEATEDEDMSMNVTAQIQELKQKMDRVMQMTNRASGESSGSDASSTDPSLRTIPSKNDTQSNNGTDSNSEKSKVKRMSFREKQALRLQQRKEREIARESVRPKFRLGADCESLICASCKSIIDEFGQLVFGAIRNAKVKYIDQLTESFCSSKVISVKYIEVVTDVCQAFEQETLGYKEAMVTAFEGLQKWEEANKLPVLAKLKKNVSSINKYPLFWYYIIFTRTALFQ